MRVLFLISMLALVSLLGASLAAARYIRGARRTKPARMASVSDGQAESLILRGSDELDGQETAASIPATEPPQGEFSDPKPLRSRDALRARAVATHR